MFGIGFTEIIIILGIALVVIGPKNLPNMAKSMGKGYVEFMKAFREMQSSIEQDVTEIKSTLDPTSDIYDTQESDDSEKKDEPKKANVPPPKPQWEDEGE